jgi:hypothetical protein
MEIFPVSSNLGPKSKIFEF